MVVALVSDGNGPCRGCLLIYVYIHIPIGPFSINTLISMVKSASCGRHHPAVPHNLHCLLFDRSCSVLVATD
jgi:hypothetical protein